ncbi:MAG: cation-translocating P-type ATPase [Spirochaetaceae bacterium]|nr:MAG: cation-translocating P-type ATPase [Spirochaetaceae bacterium]
MFSIRYPVGSDCTSPRSRLFRRRGRSPIWRRLRSGRSPGSDAWRRADPRPLYSSSTSRRSQRLTLSSSCVPRCALSSSSRRGSPRSRRTPGDPRWTGSWAFLIARTSGPECRSRCPNRCGRAGIAMAANLLECPIVHSLPGRVRLRNRGLRYLVDVAHEVGARIRVAHGIQDVVITPLTGSILVTYRHDEITVDDVREAAEYAIGEYSLEALKAERSERYELPVSERRVQNEPLGELVGRVAAAGGALAVTMLMRRSMRATVGRGLMSQVFRLPFLTSVFLAWPILVSGVRSLFTHRRPNADTLSATAIVASLLTGETVSALTVIFLADIAELLTAYSMDRTRKAIRSMLSVGETEVWKVVEGDLERVALEDLSPGDHVLTGTGERISVDGVVVDGTAAVDQASITGEFLPANKVPGDEVFAGTVVRSGSLTVLAHRVGDETAAGRVIHLVEEATHRKANIQFFADRFSAQFIPVNFLLAILVFALTRSPVRALNMLIIDYSCGVRLSTATALASSISNAARQGVLIKGGNYLELLADADTLVLDKTGTVTTGQPVVALARSLDPGVTEAMLIEYAAAAEKTVTHPMATAILSRARQQRVRTLRAHGVQVEAGRGVTARIERTRVIVGSRTYVRDAGIDLDAAHAVVSECAARGESVVYVAIADRLAGVIAVKDDLKENMKKAVNRLRNNGFDDIILLTGDMEQQAEVVSSRMALDRFTAEAMPETKADTILRLQSKGIRVVMVGDGINDAPALAYADVGIAMGAARTDIAIDAADITIAPDNPLLLPGAVGLARKTMRIVKQNFVAAIGINSAGLVLSSLGLLPVFWAAVLHNATTVMVVANSTRLLSYDLTKGGKA